MDIVTLNEMIEVLEDGHKFYTEAAAKVGRADLKALFQDLAKTKETICNDLKTAAKGGERVRPTTAASPVCCTSFMPRFALS